jgi:hypothetical protein
MRCRKRVPAAIDTPNFATCRASNRVSRDAQGGTMRLRELAVEHNALTLKVKDVA